MELKRYVMLNNNAIYDLVSVSSFKKYEMIKGSNHFDYQVKATSYNILDLVEIGDLVELKNDTRMFHIHNQRWLDDFLSKVQEPEEDEFKIKDNIVAIYKRQPNGDYKRYEVK